MKKIKEPWLITYTGRDIEFTKPEPADISICDIAIALSRKARFNGHTVGLLPEIYSVAQHSCHVFDKVRQTTKCPTITMTALLHDAAEAYLPDVHTDLKSMLFGFEELEGIFNMAIADRFSLSGDNDRMPLKQDVKVKTWIKGVDTRMLATERRDVVAEHARSWGEAMDTVTPYPDKMVPWGIQKSYEQFMRRYMMALESLANAGRVIN